MSCTKPIPAPDAGISASVAVFRGNAPLRRRVFVVPASSAPARVCAEAARPVDNPARTDWSVANSNTTQPCSRTRSSLQCSKVLVADSTPECLRRASAKVGLAPAPFQRLTACPSSAGGSATTARPSSGRISGCQSCRHAGRGTPLGSGSGPSPEFNDNLTDIENCTTIENSVFGMIGAIHCL